MARQRGDGTYMLFASMEEEVREHVRFGALKDSKERCRERITTAVSSNDEVFVSLVYVNSRDRGNPCTNCSGYASFVMGNHSWIFACRYVY